MKLFSFLILGLPAIVSQLKFKKVIILRRDGGFLTIQLLCMGGYFVFTNKAEDFKGKQQKLVSVNVLQRNCSLLTRTPSRDLTQRYAAIMTVFQSNH